jgi:hypothetical protein
MQTPELILNPSYQNNKYQSHSVKIIPLTEFSPTSIDKNEFDQKRHDPKFITVFQEILEGYFKMCIREDMVPTMTDLANLFHTDRLSFLRSYVNDPILGPLFLSASQHLIAHVERLLLSGKSPIGLIFWLKNNANWIDKHEFINQNKTIGEILDEIRQGEVIEQIPNQTPNVF